MSNIAKRKLVYLLGILANIALIITWVVMEEPNPWRIPALILGAPFLLFALLMSFTGNFQSSAKVASLLVPSYFRNAFSDDKTKHSN